MLSPFNEAFQRVGGNLANMSDTDLLHLIEYHAASKGVFYSSILYDGMTIGTLWGEFCSFELLPLARSPLAILAQVQAQHQNPIQTPALSLAAW